MKKYTYKLKSLKGVTLIELTVVIAIILLLISILFIGAKYYKDSADKSACIVNINGLQKGLRSIANIDNVPETKTIKAGSLVGAGKPFEKAPTCPTDGTTGYDPDPATAVTVPAVGTVAFKCNSAEKANHVPDATKTTSW